MDGILDKILFEKERAQRIKDATKQITGKLQSETDEN